MNQLIKITQNENNEQVVSGRELHDFLEVGTAYKDWFPRMLKYGFVENIDFVAIAQKRATAQGNQTEYIDHALKLDMAKEISMIQRNEKGKEARQYFIQVEKQFKQAKLTAPQDDYTKRLRAEAMSQNAKNRAAKVLIEMSKEATTEVNKALLQDKAVEVLTGEKLLELPTLREKFYSPEEIAQKLGILSKTEKPHGSAVSQLIQTQLILTDDEVEVFVEAVGNWSGTVTKYAEAVLEKVSEWLVENNFPSVIVGKGRKNYHVHYRKIA